MTNTPTVAPARGFYIDPLLRWGGGGPQWFWPLPWPYATQELAAELRRADIDLDAMGYCGPDDRGAYFRSVLCLVWPDAESQVFEGRLAGQFGVYGGRNSAGDLIDDYFVPDGEAVALASLAVDARQRYSDVERAFEALREGLSD